jgi:hypothetical protein
VMCVPPLHGNAGATSSRRVTADEIDGRCCTLPTELQSVDKICNRLRQKLGAIQLWYRLIWKHEQSC